MKKRFQDWLRLSVLFLGVFFSFLTFFVAQRVYADCGGVQTSVINCNTSEPKEAIFVVLGMVLNILTFGVGIAATAGIVKIKTRILHIVIGLVLYFMFWGVITLLIPGGISS